MEKLDRLTTAQRLFASEPGVCVHNEMCKLQLSIAIRDMLRAPTDGLVWTVNASIVVFDTVIFTRAEL